MLGLVYVNKLKVRRVRYEQGTGIDAFSIHPELPVYAACANSKFSTTCARLIK